MVQRIPTSDRNKRLLIFLDLVTEVIRNILLFIKTRTKKNLRLLNLDEKTAMTLEYKKYKMKEHSNKKYLDTYLDYFRRLIFNHFSACWIMKYIVCLRKKKLLIWLWKKGSKITLKINKFFSFFVIKAHTKFSPQKNTLDKIANTY